MGLEKPEPALLSQPSPRLSFDDTHPDHLDTAQHNRPKSEFDPCVNAKICSPFYLYNHDSPRQSENKSRPDISIAVRDLESGITPVSTNTHKGSSPALEKRNSNDSGVVRNGKWQVPWARRMQQGSTLNRCMTKPKVSRWKSIPQRQRLIIKILLALIMVGLIIGLAVGLTKALGGGVWKSNNATSGIA
ncbi:uncharacterized protein AB675_713 [Cyphellophora attinorum]|uniref:Uncharacterized protein n=1 Tax=Cyphellophora attinorum TaxID=1664694 RepID=A0A0N1HB52_9EURO|nr:uncharacterized protein AB675_713 [Phialophora attinorum]KPI45642.1 hypothetical protein AB675_713 [Phialophora attinorum]